MGLFSKRWENENKEKALSWIACHRGTDMIDAITTAKDRDIKVAAMNRLIDQINSKDQIELIKSYMNLIFEKCDYTTTKYIIQGIIYQDFLKDLASKCSEEAIKCIKDQDVIYDILTNRNFFISTDLFSEWERQKCKNRGQMVSEYCVELAFENFNCIEKYLDVLKNTPYRNIAFPIAFKVRNKELADIKEIVLNDKYSEIARSGALCAIQEEKDLCDIIDKLNDGTLKYDAIVKIKTPEVRAKYCDKFDTHEWELIDTIHNEVGDHDYMQKVFKCKYCGKKKTEDETYVY